MKTDSFPMYCWGLAESRRYPDWIEWEDGSLTPGNVLECFQEGSYLGSFLMFGLATRTTQAFKTMLSLSSLLQRGEPFIVFFSLCRREATLIQTHAAALFGLQLRSPCANPADDGPGGGLGQGSSMSTPFTGGAGNKAWDTMSSF